uniref:Fibronectin type-III domain-containing protein n=1 Tax=Bicosoecida sp. CB-2014 TaxID=1486930 RepID=A0A7S1G683_9STRA|mmetsp:Transcript_14534/g.50626  ORF Transcript_14534/g.50626 Transcript_14534/m.50626 type:complete len:111 (+) Transcript_14534:107-439(+)
MAALATPGKPRAQNPQETSLDVEWDAVDGATGYELEYKEYAPDHWEGSEKMVVPAEPTRVTVEPLNPTTSYQFRIVAIRGEERSAPGEEGYGDTLVANCGPKGGSGCAVQ